MELEAELQRPVGEAAAMALEAELQRLGTRVATRTARPPKVDAAQEAAFIKKVIELAPRYRTELLKDAKSSDSKAKYGAIVAR